MIGDCALRGWVSVSGGLLLLLRKRNSINEHNLLINLEVEESEQSIWSPLRNSLNHTFDFYTTHHSSQETLAPLSRNNSTPPHNHTLDEWLCLCGWKKAGWMFPLIIICFHPALPWMMLRFLPFLFSSNLSISCLLYVWVGAITFIAVPIIDTVIDDKNFMMQH